MSFVINIFFAVCSYKDAAAADAEPPLTDFEQSAEEFEKFLLNNRNIYFDSIPVKKSFPQLFGFSDCTIESSLESSTYQNHCKDTPLTLVKNFVALTSHA